MIDILSIRPTDTATIAQLVDLLHEHCDTDQCERFLSDLYRWNRLHERTTRNLERSEEWQEIQQWREFILSLPTSTTDRHVA